MKIPQENPWSQVKILWENRNISVVLSGSTPTSPSTIVEKCSTLYYLWLFLWVCSYFLLCEVFKVKNKDRVKKKYNFWSTLLLHFYEFVPILWVNTGISTETPAKQYFLYHRHPCKWKNTGKSLPLFLATIYNTLRRFINSLCLLKKWLLHKS